MFCWQVELTVEEMAMFEQRLGTALLSPKQRDSIRSALKNPPSLEKWLDGLGEEAGRLALRDAVLMAASDGTVDEDEREALDKIAEHLNLSPDAINRLLSWTVEGYAWMQAGYDLLNNLSRWLSVTRRRTLTIRGAAQKNRLHPSFSCSLGRCPC